MGQQLKIMKTHSKFRLKENLTYDGVSRVSGLRREPVVADFDPLEASSVHRTRNEKVGIIFLSWIWVQCGVLPETTGSLRNPETRRHDDDIYTICNRILQLIFMRSCSIIVSILIS